MMADSSQRQIPTWLRWLALLWLVVWVPTYWRTWGWPNFVHLCDVAVFLTCAGLWFNNALLLSSQAISSIAVDFVWSLDVLSRLLFAKHLLGGTEYLWDARVALWVRLLSLFHIVWPFLLLWAIFRLGYDRRGWILQTGIAAAVLIASRFFGPSHNYNYAFTDPFFHRVWGPPVVHLAVVLAGLVVLDYLPTHLVLARFFSPPLARGNQSAAL